MALSNGYDVRASSLVGDVDAAIERVVAHFEDNDIALRVDVLRALAAQAKLAFETERMRERLRQHPITRDLIDAVTTQSSVYERLAAGLSVQEFSSEYDAQRNVEILATVQWLLKEDDGSVKHQKKKKARKALKAATVDRSVPLILRYAYSRSLSEDESATLVEFRVTSSVGNGGKPKELVHFAMSSSSPYPRSFYEDQNDGGDMSDDDEEEEEEESSSKVVEQTEDESEEEPVDSEANGEADEEEGSEAGEEEGSEASEEEGGEEQQFEGPFGEAVEAFAFDESEAVEDILAWLGEDNVDPADVIGFFLALPVYEDEWQLDERITEIVFNQSEGEGDDVSGDESD